MSTRVSASRAATRRTCALGLALLLSGAFGAGAGRAGEGTPSPSVTVMTARIRPVKDSGKPWDADESDLPRALTALLAGASGFPALSTLALVPHHNRPDPYVIVRAGGDEIARSKAVQGAFLPCWRLEVPLDAAALAAKTLTFEVLDEDLKDDDEVGKASAETADLLKTPGVQVLSGTHGLYDLEVVVHRPDLGTGSPLRKVHVESLDLAIRETRPTGGDWDAGGNPLRGHLPRHLPMPHGLQGLPQMRPDPRITLIGTDGSSRTSEVFHDTFRQTWKEAGFDFEGRTGVGDGLFVDVTDVDVAFDDPVGVLFVPIESFLAKADGGELTLPADENSGIAKVVLRFRVE